MSPEPMNSGIGDSTRTALPVAFSSVASRKYPEKIIPIKEELDDTKGNYGKHGMTLTRIETVQNWTSPESLIVWETTFLEDGEYSAEIICAEPSFETNCSAPIADIPCSLTVGDMKNSVSSGIKYSYNLNSSGSCNIRHAKDGGTFKIEKAPITMRVILSKENDELGWGISSVKFVKIK